MDTLEKLDYLMENLRHIPSQKSRDWVEKLYEYYLEYKYLSRKQHEIIDRIYREKFQQIEKAKATEAI